jgi:FkbM family methyltransferase
MYWRGWTFYEPEALPVFYALAKKAEVILDIGAHIGLYSLSASYANPRARIFAFEPLPSARDLFLANIRHNHRSNIEVVPCAVSDHHGPRPFYCPNSRAQGIPSISSLSRDFVSRALSEPELPSLQVEVTTIDRFCHQRGITDVGLAKLDIESLEPQAMEGMRGSIERAHPHLFVEILQGNGTSTALDSLARQFGYNVFALDPEGPRLQRPITVNAGRPNYLFTRMSPTELHRLITEALPHRDSQSWVTVDG